MSEPPEGKLRHLIVNGFHESSEYSSPNSGRPPGFRTPRRDREAHSQRLTEQLQYAQAREVEIVRQQRAIGLDAGNGIYIKFESDPGFELKFKSLEFTTSGIELCSVKRIGTTGTTTATVFVPEGKLDHFLKRITKYKEEDTKPRTEEGISKACHKDLVESIGNIRLASLEALWTDDPALFPQADEPIWWEIWLRDNETLDYEGLAREHLNQMELTVSPDSIKFIDRTIILVNGSKTQLTNSILLLGFIAEVRKAKENASFFLGLDRKEQNEWVTDLVERTTPPGPNPPSVCIMDTGVNCLHPLLAICSSDDDMHTYSPEWGTDDRFGHGTQMAGLATYGDLTNCLGHTDEVSISGILESAKIIPSPRFSHEKHLYGAIIRESVARVEVGGRRLRTFCLAVTADDARDRGKPSSWSASIDAISSGYEDEQRRLFILSAGNTDPGGRADYPCSNFTDEVHDPGQSWNSLTVGAYTDKDNLDTEKYPGWTPIAPRGDIAPSSCTSMQWAKAWPIKPEIVLEGGNMGKNPADGSADYIDDNLQLLTTGHQPLLDRQIVSFGDTSAAAALAAKHSCDLQATYPEFWPETIKALFVHSAEWTEAMKERFDLKKQKGYRQLLKYCGYGVPNFEKLAWSTKSSLCIVSQEMLQPYQRIGSKKPSTRDINIYMLPWPDEVLANIPEDTPVEMKVTLSYFIEPNPGARGWSTKYQYASHGLRFQVRRPLESLDSFKARINQKARDEELGRYTTTADSGKWQLGEKLRTLGSIHSDTWTGNALELIQRKNLAIYPVGGWWKERIKADRWHKSARYALIVSLSTPTLETDMYTPIAQQIENRVGIEV